MTVDIVANPRHRQIAALLASGLTDERIASYLEISVRTARRWISDYFAEMNARCRFQAGIIAAVRGDVSREQLRELMGVEDDEVLRTPAQAQGGGVSQGQLPLPLVWGDQPTAVRRAPHQVPAWDGRRRDGQPGDAMSTAS